MRLIFFTSPKGSCGASFCTSCLAGVLAYGGRKCLAVDLCFRASSLDRYFGCSDGFVFNLSDVLMQRCSFDEALIKNVSGTGVDFASASVLKDADADECCEIISLIRQNAIGYDYVFADIPFCAVSDRLTVPADTLVYVTDTQRATVAALERYVQSASASCSTYVIINKVIPELITDGNAVNIDDICDLAGIPPLGVIPWEPDIAAYVNAGVLSVTNENLLSTKALFNTAERVIGNRASPVDFDYRTLYYKKIKNITYRR